MYLEQFSLLYCWIHKVASSSWNRIFFELNNMAVPEDSDLHSASHHFRPKDDVALRDLFAKSTVSFAFVRHPFERLVSVYRDKFELATETEMRELLFKHYAAKILARSDSSHHQLTKKLNQRPSFPQFVSYLLNTSVLDYDYHWLPYWLHCQFCHNKFSVIGMFETMKEDVEYIISASHLNISSSSFPWINSHLARNSDHKRLSVKYFREIDKESLKKLYDIYKYDFEMFGYSVDEYLLQ